LAVCAAVLGNAVWPADVGLSAAGLLVARRRHRRRRLRPSLCDHSMGRARCLLKHLILGNVK